MLKFFSSFLIQSDGVYYFPKKTSFFNIKKNYLDLFLVTIAVLRFSSHYQPSNHYFRPSDLSPRISRQYYDSLLCYHVRFQPDTFLKFIFDMSS